MLTETYNLAAIFVCYTLTLYMQVRCSVAIAHSNSGFPYSTPVTASKEFLMAYGTIMMPWHEKQVIVIHMPQHILEKKRKDYAFRRQFNEKPSIIPGCPGPYTTMIQSMVVQACLI